MVLSCLIPAVRTVDQARLALRIAQTKAWLRVSQGVEGAFRTQEGEEIQSLNIRRYAINAEEPGDERVTRAEHMLYQP